MKNLFLFFALVFTTSLVSAQDLTPEMLVGEYEGKAEVYNFKTSEKKIHNDANLVISSIESRDSLKFNLSVGRKEVVAYLYIKEGKIFISKHEVEDLDIFIKTTDITFYSGDKVTVSEPSFDSDKQIFKVSISSIITFSDTPDKSEICFYIEMKKK